MKKIFFAAAMLSALLIFIKLNDIYISHITSEFNNITEKIENNIKMNDYTLAKQNILNLENLWHKKTSYIQSVSHHSDWEKIFDIIKRCDAFIQNKETSLLIAELNSLRAKISHICEEEKLSFSNIL